MRIISFGGRFHDSVDTLRVCGCRVCANAGVSDHNPSNNLLRQTMSWIYFVESAGCYKIGMTTDVQDRLSQIRTHNPHDVRLVAKVKVQNNTAGHVEKALHSYYQPALIRGEWFDLNPREVAGFKLIDSVDAERLDQIVKSQPANADLKERGSLVAKLSKNTTQESTKQTTL